MQLDFLNYQAAKDFLPFFTEFGYYETAGRDVCAI